MKKKLTEKDLHLQERYDELYDKAVSRYLDKTDFDITEWLSDNENLEFMRLEYKLGFTEYNPDEI